MRTTSMYSFLFVFAIALLTSTLVATEKLDGGRSVEVSQASTPVAATGKLNGTLRVTESDTLRLTPSSNFSNGSLPKPVVSTLARSLVASGRTLQELSFSRSGPCASLVAGVVNKSSPAPASQEPIMLSGRPVRLPWRGWVSNQIAQVAAQIILEDVLGYQVVFVDRLGQSQRSLWPQDMVDNQDYDADVELWTILPDYRVKYLNTGLAKQLGELGYYGRSGIFVPQHTVVKEPMSDYYLFWSSGSPGVNRTNYLLAGDSDLQTLLGSTFPACEQSWCTNSRWMPDRCLGTRCVELIKSWGDYDTGWVEQLINNHGLRVGIGFYGSDPMKNYVGDLVRAATKDFLVYYYAPDPFLVRNKLQRLSFPDYTLGCDADNTREPSGPVKCDFSNKVISKMVRSDFRSIAPRAVSLFEKIAMFEEELNDILRDVDAMAGGAWTYEYSTIEQRVCSWLGTKTEVIKQNWLPPCVRQDPTQIRQVGEEVYDQTEGKCMPFQRQCPSGQELKKDKCLDCDKGRYQEKVGQPCRDCPAGKVQAAKGRVFCDPCTPGHFARDSGLTTCTRCTVGRFAGDYGRTECMPCIRGTFQDEAGIQALNAPQSAAQQQSGGSRYCQLCPAGRVTENEGMSMCQSCETGSFSEWGGRQCLNCTIGKFQDQPGSSTCKKCPEGANCPRVGLSKGINEKGFWAFRVFSNEELDDEDKAAQNEVLEDSSTSSDLVWLPCITPAECLPGEKCLEGQTGPLCRLCLIGFSREETGSTCVKCPPLWLNMTISVVVVGAACTVVFCLSYGVVYAAQKPTAIHAVLLKLLLNYYTTMSVLYTLLQYTINERRQVFQEALGWARSLITVLDYDGSLSVQTTWWRIDCLFYPWVVQPEYENLINTLGSVSHADYYKPEYQEARETLRNFHHNAEFRRLVFFTCVPVLFILALYGIGLLIVLIHQKRNKDFYFSAWEFYTEVRLRGFSKAHRMLKMPVWVSYVEAYDYKLLGIWNMVELSDTQPLSRKWTRRFLEEGRPLVVVSLFLVYGTVIKAVLRPLHCQKFTESGKSRLSVAFNIICYDPTDLLFLLAVVSSLFWAVVCPILGFKELRKRRERFFEKSVIQDFGFLFIGYELNKYGWEFTILVRKAIIFLIETIDTKAESRLLLFLLTGMFVLFIHLKYTPFDNRYDYLLDRVETRHLTLWVWSCLLMQCFYIGGGPKVIITICVVVVTLHTAFVIAVLRHIWRHLVASTAEGIAAKENMKADIKALHKMVEAEDTESQDWHKVAFEKIGSTVFHAHHTPHPLHESLAKRHSKVESKEMARDWQHWFVKVHLEMLHRKGYLCMLHRHGWMSLLGNFGDKCLISYVPPEVSAPLPSCVKKHDDRISFPKRSARKYMRRMICDALQTIIADRGLHTWSVSILEFVIRFGFTTNVEGHLSYVQEMGGPQAVDDYVQDDAEEEHDPIALLEKGPEVGQEQTERSPEEVKALLLQESLERRVEKKLEKDEEQGIEEDEEDAELELDEAEDDGPIESEESVEGRLVFMIKKMFSSSYYMRGLMLHELQLNLLAINKVPKSELVRLLDMFEEAWGKHHLRYAMEQEKHHQAELRKEEEKAAEQKALEAAEAEEAAGLEAAAELQKLESFIPCEGVPRGEAQVQTDESIPCFLPKETEDTRETRASDRWATLLVCLVCFSDYKSSMSWVSLGFALHRKCMQVTNGLHKQTVTQLEELRSVQAQTKAVEQQIADIEEQVAAEAAKAAAA